MRRRSCCACSTTRRRATWPGSRHSSRSHGVALYLQRGGLDTVTPLTPPAAPLRYELPGLAAGIEFAPTDFVQVNGPLNRLMVDRAHRTARAAAGRPRPRPLLRARQFQPAARAPDGERGRRRGRRRAGRAGAGERGAQRHRECGVPRRGPRGGGPAGRLGARRLRPRAAGSAARRCARGAARRHGFAPAQDRLRVLPPRAASRATQAYWCASTITAW